MCLRTIQRKNGDGSVVRYLQLGQNLWDRERKRSVTKVLCSLGREDALDKEGLARLICSMCRLLDPDEALVATSAGEVSLLDSRPMGVGYVCDQLWRRLSIGSTITKVADARRVNGPSVERVIFAMVANRFSATPLSKLATCEWEAKRSHVELQEALFFTVANLLNLEVDLLFFDTSSTYFEADRLEDEMIEDEDAESDGAAQTPAHVPAHEALTESGTRAYNSASKDHRPDLRRSRERPGDHRKGEGRARRLEALPGDLVSGPGFNSAENRRYLQRGGGHYIVGEKLRSDAKEATAALSRQGRYHKVAPNLAVKEVRVDDGVMRDRFVVCMNTQRARRDALVRGQILAHLENKIAGSDSLAHAKRDELFGALSTRPAYKRFLRRTKSGLLRIDRGAVAKEKKLDGKFLLRTSDESLSAQDIALGYKGLYEVEDGWRQLKSTIELRPIWHRREDRIRAHVQLCWLALLLLRVAEIAVGDTWRNIRGELDCMHLVTMATSEGRVSQRTETTSAQRSILAAMDIPDPPGSIRCSEPRESASERQRRRSGSGRRRARRRACSRPSRFNHARHGPHNMGPGQDGNQVRKALVHGEPLRVRLPCVAADRGSADRQCGLTVPGRRMAALSPSTMAPAWPSFSALPCFSGERLPVPPCPSTGPLTSILALVAKSCPGLVDRPGGDKLDRLPEPIADCRLAMMSYTLYVTTNASHRWMSRYEGGRDKMSGFHPSRRVTQ